MTIKGNEASGERHTHARTQRGKKLLALHKSRKESKGDGEDEGKDEAKEGDRRERMNKVRAKILLKQDAMRG